MSAYEYKNKIEIFVKRYCRETALTSAEDYSQEALLVLIGIFDRYRYDKNASINTYFSYAINDVLKLQKRILNRGNKISTISLDQEIYGSNMRIENIIADQKSYNRPEYQLRLNENKSYYLNKIEKSEIINFINLENINYEIEKLQNEINNKKIRSHTLELDQKNIEPKLDNLSKIEEELVNNNERMSTLNKLNLSFELAKEILAESYEEMRNTVTPKFTQELSKNISEITEKKYSKIMFNDEQGLIVELESGNYVPASKLSIGTIDQLYLSLRLSMIDELSEENLPIILDEAFAYYDTERLTNILKYLDEKYKTHQIILFTCTNREKEILEKIKVPYNLIEL